MSIDGRWPRLFAFLGGAFRHPDPKQPFETAEFGALITACGDYDRDSRAAISVFRRSMVIVIGPTPRGTGEIAEATSLTAAKSTSPTSLSPTRLMPTSI